VAQEIHVFEAIEVQSVQLTEQLVQFNPFSKKFAGQG